MICPSCEQGRVYTVRLILLDEIGYLCEECDALWLHKPDIAADSFVAFEAYMASRGRPGLWTEVEVLTKETPPV